VGWASVWSLTHGSMNKNHNKSVAKQGVPAPICKSLVTQAGRIVCTPPTHSGIEVGAGLNAITMLWVIGRLSSRNGRLDLRAAEGGDFKLRYEFAVKLHHQM